MQTNCAKSCCTQPKSTVSDNGAESLPRLLAVSIDTDFWGDNITLREKDGSNTPVANLVRPSGLSLDKEWKFTLYGGNKSTWDGSMQSAQDPLALALMAG